MTDLTKIITITSVNIKDAMAKAMKTKFLNNGTNFKINIMKCTLSIFLVLIFTFQFVQCQVIDSLTAKSNEDNNTKSLCLRLFGLNGTLFTQVRNCITTIYLNLKISISFSEPQHVSILPIFRVQQLNLWSPSLEKS